jgi:hypothetical protein
VTEALISHLECCINCLVTFCLAGTVHISSSTGIALTDYALCAWLDVTSTCNLRISFKHVGTWQHAAASWRLLLWPLLTHSCITHLCDRSNCQPAGTASWQ